MIKPILLFVLISLTSCNFDTSKIPQDARLITSDEDAFEHCDTLYKEGQLWGGYHYAGYGTANINGKKIQIYASLSHEGTYPVSLNLLFLNIDSILRRGNVVSFDLDFSDIDKIIFLKDREKLSTRFLASQHECFSYGFYHIKDFNDNRSYIKIIEFDKDFRLKARFNMVFEVDESYIKDIDKAGLPHEIILSDGIVMAGFLPKTE
jgi:hypothetical protein